VRCIFVEKATNSYARLCQAVRAASDIEAQAIHGSFEDHVTEILDAIGSAFSLIFIDPKGWSFDLRKLGPLLRHKPSEVIVNFMFEHVNRFLNDPRPEIRASYNLPFGDSNWRSRFEALLSSGLGREEAVLELFREQLKAVGEFTYVLSARIQRPTADRSHFYLVYGTRNQKGLIEFRNVEKKAMAAEEHSRIEAQRDRQYSRTGQGRLAIDVPRPVASLRGPEIEQAKRWVRSRLAPSSPATYASLLENTLERFAVTEPEFKDLLVDMQRHAEIKFEGMAPRQRKPGAGTTVSLLE
jgi:hypothetical protein